MGRKTISYPQRDEFIYVYFLTHLERFLSQEAPGRLLLSPRQGYCYKTGKGGGGRGTVLPWEFVCGNSHRFPDVSPGS